MSDERDDEILGRALSRAIETQDPNETPYERSRIAAQSSRRGFPLWQLTGAAATLVFAVAVGSWLGRPSDNGPVAASATPTASPAATGTATTPAPSGATVATRVFFVRDQLPPVSAYLPSGGAHIPVDSIRERIAVTRAAPVASIPRGASNPLATVPITPDASAVVARVDGDTAEVAFDLPNGWGVRGAAQVHALVQQLVYVITEEPGIRRARIIERGKTNAIIDGLVVDRPLTREDVTDYEALGSTKVAQGYGGASPTDARTLTTSTSVEQVAPGLARVVITTDLPKISPTVLYPDFRVEVVENDEVAMPLGGKWRMVVTVNGTDSTTGARTIDQSPLRSLVAGTPKCLGCIGTIYVIGLDDLRPWRTAIAYDPFRIIIDIGGDPRTIAANNAVYAPAHGATVGRTFDVTGIAHNFEANVVIRVRDERENVVLQTSTTATNCCEPGGAFAKSVTLPQSVSGRVYLEVYEASAKDGSDQALIRIPLTVR